MFRSTTFVLLAAFVLVRPGAISAAMIDVTRHGAVPDDGSDDLRGIQQAIRLAGPGDTVFLPAGTFTISASIQPKSGTRLQGAGRDATFIQFSGSASHPMIRMDGRAPARDIELSGFTLDGMENPAVEQGILAQRGQNLTLMDLRVRNLSRGDGFGPHGVYLLGDSAGTRIVNCHFENIGTAAEFGGGIRIEGPSGRVMITGNTIDRTGRGGIFLTETTDAVIRSNRVSGSGLAEIGLGIEIHTRCDRTIIEDNVIDRWLSVDGSSDVAVRRNRIGGGEGAVQFAGLELASGGRNVIFADNRVEGGSEIGWSLSSGGTTDNVLFLRNVIRGARHWGAQIQGDTAGATHLLVVDSVFEGTAGDEDWNGQGFRVNGGTRALGLIRCAIRNNRRDGLQWRTDDAASLPISRFTLRDCELTGNGGSALAGTADHQDLSGNTVTGNGSDAWPSSHGFTGNTALRLLIRIPEGARSGVPVEFTGEATSEGEIVRWLWDFGEGLPASEERPVRTFTRPGSHRVFCVVWDDGGRPAWAEATVQVEAWAAEER